jgi:hypothetical protein
MGKMKLALLTHSLATPETEKQYNQPLPRPAFFRHLVVSKSDQWITWHMPWTKHSNIRWAGHVAHNWEKRNALKSLVTNLGQHSWYNVGWTIQDLIRDGQEIFMFSEISRLAVGPTQPAIQCALGALYLQVKWTGCEVGHSLPSSAEINE